MVEIGCIIKENKETKNEYRRKGNIFLLNINNEVFLSQIFILTLIKSCGVGYVRC